MPKYSNKPTGVRGRASREGGGLGQAIRDHWNANEKRGEQFASTITDAVKEGWNSYKAWSSNNADNQKATGKKMLRQIGIETNPETNLPVSLNRNNYQSELQPRAYVSPRSKDRGWKQSAKAREDSANKLDKYLRRWDNTFNDGDPTKGLRVRPSPHSTNSLKR